MRVSFIDSLAIFPMHVRGYHRVGRSVDSTGVCLGMSHPFPCKAKAGAYCGQQHDTTSRVV